MVLDLLDGMRTLACSDTSQTRLVFGAFTMKDTISDSRRPNLAQLKLTYQESNFLKWMCQYAFTSSLGDTVKLTKRNGVDVPNRELASPVEPRSSSYLPLCRL